MGLLKSLSLEVSSGSEKPMWRERNSGQAVAIGRAEAPSHRLNRSGSANEVIESGDFRIDLAARSATLRGQELRLTCEEFDVLVFLTNHPQRLITPHTLLSTSGKGNVRQTRFLQVLLSLMRKLDALGGSGQHYIRTEPWVVYRFDSTSSSAP